MPQIQANPRSTALFIRACNTTRRDNIHCLHYVESVQDIVSGAVRRELAQQRPPTSRRPPATARSSTRPMTAASIGVRSPIRARAGAPSSG